LTNPKLVYVQEQKWIVGVVSMVPIYATESVRFYYSLKYIPNSFWLGWVSHLKEQLLQHFSTFVFSLPVIPDYFFVESKIISSM